MPLKINFPWKKVHDALCICIISQCLHSMFLCVLLNYTPRSWSKYSILQASMVHFECCYCYMSVSKSIRPCGCIQVMIFQKNTDF